MYVTSGETKRDKQRHKRRDKQRHKRRDKQRHNVTSEQDKQRHKRTPHRSGRPSLGFYFFIDLLIWDVAGRSSFAVPRQVLIHFDGSCCGASLALPKLRMCAASFHIRPYSKLGTCAIPALATLGAFLGGCHRLGPPNICTMPKANNEETCGGFMLFDHPALNWRICKCMVAGGWQNRAVAH